MWSSSFLLIMKNRSHRTCIIRRSPSKLVVLLWVFTSGGFMIFLRYEGYNPRSILYSVVMVLKNTNSYKMHKYVHVP